MKVCALYGADGLFSRLLPTACVCKGVKELCQVPFLVGGTDLVNNSCAGKRGIYYHLCRAGHAEHML